MTLSLPPGVTAAAAAEAMKRLARRPQSASSPHGSAVGSPKEKIRIEPVETPVPEKTPAPVEQPVEVPEKVPA